MKPLGFYRPSQHTPHRLRRLPMGYTGDVGISVQGKPRGEVAQHPRHRFHVHPVLQCQGGESVAQIVEPHLGQSCPFQHPMEHMQHAVRGNRPAIGGREHPWAIAHFSSLFFQNAYRILCQRQGAVGVFRFQRRFHHFPVDAGDLPAYRSVTHLQTRSAAGSFAAILDVLQKTATKYGRKISAKTRRRSCAGLPSGRG